MTTSTLNIFVSFDVSLNLVELKSMNLTIKSSLCSGTVNFFK